MSNVTMAEAKNHFADVVRRVERGGERVIVLRYGKPIAAIVCTEDVKRLEAAEDAKDRTDAATALREAKSRGVLPLDVVLEKHGLSHLLVGQPPLAEPLKARLPGRVPSRPLRAPAPKLDKRNGTRR